MAVQPKSRRGGDHLTQTLLDGTHFSLIALTALLLTRFVLGPLSHSAPVVGDSSPDDRRRRAVGCAVRPPRRCRIALGKWAIW